MIFAYFGPETVLPLTSAVATITGVMLVCGKGVFRFMAMTIRGMIGRRSTSSPVARAKRATLRPDGPSSARPSQPAPTPAQDYDRVEA